MQGGQEGGPASHPSPGAPRQPSLTSSALDPGGTPLGALRGPAQLPALHSARLAGLHHDGRQPLAQPRALLPGAHRSLQAGRAGVRAVEALGSPLPPTPALGPSPSPRAVPLPHPTPRARALGTGGHSSPRGTRAPTWAHPLGVFPRQEPEAAEVKTAQWVSPAFLHSPCWGSFPPGPWPPPCSEELGGCCHGYWASCSVPTGVRGLLRSPPTVPSASPPPIQGLPRRGSRSQGCSPAGPPRSRRPGRPAGPTSSPCSGGSLPKASTTPPLPPGRAAGGCVSAFPQRHEGLGDAQAHAGQGCAELSLTSSRAT